MTTPDPTVKVRIIQPPGARVAGLVVLAVVAGSALLALRWRRYGPYIATRTARRLRAAAQIIEDRGLDIARSAQP